MGLTEIKWVVFVVAISTLVGFSYHKGKESVQTEWDAAKAAQLIEGQELQLKYNQQEKEARDRIDELSEELRVAKEDFDRTIGEYDVRLLQSTERADIYRRQANSTASDRNRLANHAAKLDRSLTEGRQLVTELRELVKLRDRQLILLGKQLTSDRQQINEATDE